MENVKSDPERDSTPALPRDEPPPPMDLVACVGCQASVQRSQSHNGNPLFDGSVCVECNDRVIAFRLELAIAEWKEKRRGL